MPISSKKLHQKHALWSVVFIRTCFVIFSVESSSTHHQRRSYTVYEVVDAVFADDDSADECMKSEWSESEDESSESEEPVAATEPARGNVVWRGPRIRGGRS